MSTEKKENCACKRHTNYLDVCQASLQNPTLQLVSLRSDLPSCRITFETFRSCCAAADSWRLLLIHSDTLWRRPGFAGSADILLLEQKIQRSHDHFVCCVWLNETTRPHPKGDAAEFTSVGKHHNPPFVWTCSLGWTMWRTVAYLRERQLNFQLPY